MNREEEYTCLLHELDEPPAALSETVARMTTRAKRARARRLVTVPAGCAAMFFIAFMVTVNLSVQFAMACGRIPLLRELAAAVAFSPSLSAAVANEYVQPIELEQTVNGIMMRVEYVIVDQKQLNIFYSLRSEPDMRLDINPSVRSTDGAPFDGYSVSSEYYNEERTAFRSVTVDFAERDMPGSLVFACQVYDRGNENSSAPPVAVDWFAQAEHREPETLAEFAFTLDFDPAYTQRGERIVLDRSFVMDGQRLSVTDVEIYPTHIRLNLADDPDNTAWLKSLTLYLENEKAERFDAISNGIVATGSVDSPMICSYRLESAFFSQSRRLTLVITAADWLDKDKERIRVDLANTAADNLPEGVVFEQSVRRADGWGLIFSAPAREANHFYQLFMSDYYDEAGNQYSYNTTSSSSDGYLDANGAYVETPERFIVAFGLADYPYDTVYLSPIFSRRTEEEPPVVIRVK